MASSQQKVVLKVLTMTDDDKSKQKAIQAAAHIHGVDSIAADEKEGKLRVIGNMDAVALLKKVKKKVGKVDVLWVGPAIEEKEQKKKKEGNNKEEKKPVQKDKGKKIN